MVLFPCWQGKKLVFKFGKAGIGSLSLVVLLWGWGHWLRFRTGSRGCTSALALFKLWSCGKFRCSGRNILRDGGAAIVRRRAVVKNRL